MTQDASITRADLAIENSDNSNATSEPFVGQWNRLVSRTNWDKGRIICQWRDTLVAAGAENEQYSDEAWAAHVGGVSGQHVGRLRRVHLRFGNVHEEFDGLYWSHFFAALDWSDAEMWLEGAIQNGWSVSQMRGQRWETLGSPEDLQPEDADVVSSEADEDTESEEETDIGRAPSAAGHLTAVQPVDADTPTNDDELEEIIDAGVEPDEATAPATPPVRPFADLPDLPDDLAEAFDQFKVAILAHKLNEWRDASCDDVLTALNALKSLAIAPPG